MDTPNSQQQTKKTESDNRKTINRSSIISLSFELGYIIAIPLVALALLGKWLDKHYGNEFPFLTLLGIALAIATTTFWLIKRLSRYVK